MPYELRLYIHLRDLFFPNGVRCAETIAYSINIVLPLQPLQLPFSKHVTFSEDGDEIRVFLKRPECRDHLAN